MGTPSIPQTPSPGCLNHLHPCYFLRGHFWKGGLLHDWPCHLGYLASRLNSFDPPLASQGVMLVITPSSQLKTSSGSHSQMCHPLSRTGPLQPQHVLKASCTYPLKSASIGEVLLVPSNWQSSVIQKHQALSIYSPHLDWCTMWIPLVWVRARHVALEAPQQNESGKEDHYSYIQGECNSLPAFPSTYTGMQSAQGPTYLCTVETGPLRYKCCLIYMKSITLNVVGL